MNVVIYARFSSHSQTEQSIEGQLKVCYEYAESNHYTVVGEYIDRAISGTTDNRAEFQRMISDSDKHTFEGVLVYQLDRFARNRYDSAINKAKLKKNGVRVLSAKENIADDASGILVEGVLESMAEYYSVELSQKIHRGMAINAEKCLSNGSNPGLGFKVDAERRFYVDEEEAAIVREIYERYASGETKAEIIRDLKRRRVKTSLGKEFSPNSLSHLLSNKRYIGVYLYKGKETPGGMPRILDDDLFYRVQSMMNKNKNAPARTHGEGEYLLTTKLFCGHCKEMMVGYGGTSKTGRQYHYYMCKNARRKKCAKKIVSKSYIEDRVVNECLKMLTEEKIRFIAKKVAEECAKSPDNLTAKALKKAIREADTAIENLWKAIEQGRAVEMLTERLNKRIVEKAELEAELAIEENKKITLTEAQILAFLDYVCEMPADDANKRRAIINIFVHSIYLYDDHFTLIINASKKPLSIDNIPLDDIESVFEGSGGASEGCSSLSTPAPPNFRNPPRDRWVMGGISYYSKKRNEITHPLMGGIRMKAQIIAALLFLILGIVFACGKGTFLIAGYNTLPEEKKARYDARTILRDMSRMMFSCVGCMAVGILGSIVDAPWLVVLGIVLTVPVIVFFLIRINRESKR